MKYILKEKIPFTPYEVGHVITAHTNGTINLEQTEHGVVSSFMPLITIKPHEILLMVKAGILEEYDDTSPKEGEKYWNFEEAKKRLKEIMGE